MADGRSRPRGWREAPPGARLEAVSGVLRPLVLAGALVAACATPAAASGWLPASDVYTPTRPSEAVTGSTVVSDAAGASFATWSDYDGENSRLLLAAHLPGDSWSTPTPLTDTGQRRSPAALSLSTTGFGAVAYLRGDGTEYRVEVSRRIPGGDFGAAATVSAPGVDSSEPVVGVDRAGDIEVAWIDADNVVHARRFTEASDSWSSTIDDLTPPVAVPEDQDLKYLTLVMSPSGTATAAWVFDTDTTAGNMGTGLEDGTIGGTADFNVQSRTQDASGSWLPMQQSTAIVSPNVSGPPHLAVDDDGSVTLAWMEYTATPDPCVLTLASGCFQYTTATVHGQTRSPGGTWGPPETLSAADVISESPAVATTPAGETTIAWWDATARAVKVLAHSVGGVFPTASAATMITPPGSSILPLFGFASPGSSLHLTAAARGTVATFALQDDQENYRATAIFQPAGTAWPDPSTGLVTVEPRGAGAFEDVTAAIDGFGNIVTMWTREDYIRPFVGGVQSATLDVSPPAFTALNVPAAGTTGQPVAMSASTLDVWSALDQGLIDWNFGDGLADIGRSVSHVFTTPGIYTVTVGSNDTVANVATPTSRQIVISNGIAPLPSTTVATPRAKIGWKRGKLAHSSLTVSGTVGSPASLTIAMLRHGTTRSAVRSIFRAAAGPWSTTLKLPATLAPGLYDITVRGPAVQPSQTSFTLAAPASGRIARAFATRSRFGSPAITHTRSHELWAHFSFSTLPARGHRLTTRWILPNGTELAATTHARSRLLESHVGDLSGKTLPPGRWRCVLEVGGVILATVSVRLEPSP
jgi:hypothetical protein